MKVPERYLRVISGLSSVGAMGASLLLGSTLASGAVERPMDAAPAIGIADRLAIIREAVSVAGNSIADGETDSKIREVWGYRWFNGGGFGRRGWGNFRPRWNNFRPRWNNFWRNW